jgi:hypothetical protein
VVVDVLVEVVVGVEGVEFVKGIVVNVVEGSEWVEGFEAVDVFVAAEESKGLGEVDIDKLDDSLVVLMLLIVALDCVKYIFTPHLVIFIKLNTRFKIFVITTTFV